MKNLKWSRKYDKCIICGTIETEHAGNGMCNSCHAKNWRKENSEYVKKFNISDKHKESNKKWFKKDYKKRRDFHIKKSREYRINNLEKITKKKKEEYCRNKKYYIKKATEWQKAHPERTKRTRRLNQFKRLHSNPHHRLRHYISSSIRGKLKLRLFSKNYKSTFTFLPYTVDELKIHLENQFESWMDWKNWGKGKGKWNIDHIRPDSLFNYKSVEDKEFQECWALSNLQPLDAIENMRKGSKFN